MAETEAIAGFIARWQGVTGRERANYQLFLTELTGVLDLPAPEPAEADDGANAYCFERRVAFRHGDGSESYGYADLYRCGAFVLEAKDVKAPEGRRYDDAMLRARAQAEGYARALPAAEGRPPFVVVVDVGHTIELYSEFSRSGATYTPFPDPRSHRLPLDALGRPEVRERLRQVWLDPLALDPARQSARVTREIAARLARLARALEQAGHDPEAVAGFLTRCSPRTRLGFWNVQGHQERASPSSRAARLSPSRSMRRAGSATRTWRGFVVRGRNRCSNVDN